MTQHALPDLLLEDPNGLKLAELLNNWNAALLSAHSGPTRPPYAVKGTIWLRETDAVQILMVYDGTTDRQLLTGAALLALLLDVDGSESGLDADKLDGQHGSYYRNAANLNKGRVPSARLPKATKTEAEAGRSTTKLMTALNVKQAIAALTAGNAAKLDGQPASYYLNSAAQTATPLISTRANLFPLGLPHAVTVTNFAAYIGAIFTLYVKDNSGKVVFNPVEFIGDTYKVPSHAFSGAAPHTVYIHALDVGQLPSGAAKTVVRPPTSDALTYRYYRLADVIGASGMTNGAVSEWRLYSQRGRRGSDLVPSAISASYTLNARYGPAKARDGHVWTMWWTLGSYAPQWLQYDMGAAAPGVRSIQIRAYNITGVANNLFDGVRLLASNTGAFAGEEIELISGLEVTVTAPTINLG